MDKCFSFALGFRILPSVPLSYFQAFKELPRKDFNVIIHLIFLSIMMLIVLLPQYFVADSGLGAGPFKIKLTLQDGSSSITDGVVLNAVIGDA